MLDASDDVEVCLHGIGARLGIVESGRELVELPSCVDLELRGPWLSDSTACNIQTRRSSVLHPAAGAPDA